MVALDRKSVELREISFGSADYDLEVGLRARILREPLGLKFSADELKAESSEIHLGAFVKSALLGCLLIKPLSNKIAKMRQVAVAEASQGLGVGKKLVVFSEQLCRERGFETIELHARETAMSFYLALGYEVFDEPLVEVGIPHRKMRKKLRAAVWVEAYNLKWPLIFAEIKEKIWPVVSTYALAIEHVGSTSVPGLAAKPVVDIDIVIEDAQLLPRIVADLARLGYEHRGNLGIEGREAFKAAASEPKHHLYVCFKDSVALKNHLSLRDALRQDAALRDAYAELKIRAAKEFANSIDAYIDAKTDFILKILADRGVESAALKAIEKANKITT